MPDPATPATPATPEHTEGPAQPWRPNPAATKRIGRMLYDDSHDRTASHDDPDAE